MTHHYRGLVVDAVDRRVTLHGQPVDMNDKEFDLLVELLSPPVRVRTRAELLDAVWKGQRTRSLDVHVARLRARLKAAGGPGIKTEYRVGYGMVGA